MNHISIPSSENVQCQQVCRAWSTPLCNETHLRWSSATAMRSFLISADFCATWRRLSARTTQTSLPRTLIVFGSFRRFYCFHFYFCAFFSEKKHFSKILWNFRGFLRVFFGRLQKSHITFLICIGFWPDKNRWKALKAPLSNGLGLVKNPIHIKKVMGGLS